MELKEADIMTMDEVTKKYPNQWVAAKVVSRDRQTGQPLKVKVLLRNADLYTVKVNIGVDDVCTFFTGSIPEGIYVAML